MAVTWHALTQRSKGQGHRGIKCTQRGFACRFDCLCFLVVTSSLVLFYWILFVLFLLSFTTLYFVLIERFTARRDKSIIIIIIIIIIIRINEWMPTKHCSSDAAASVTAAAHTHAHTHTHTWRKLLSIYEVVDNFWQYGRFMNEPNQSKQLNAGSRKQCCMNYMGLDLS